MKKWLLHSANPEKVRKINSCSDLGPLLSEITVGRGLDTPEALVKFFNTAELSDPFALLDMDIAVEEINKAVESGQKIAVFGDYDCDGVCAAAILSGYLLSMGADVFTVIPEREGGYGLSIEAVEKMHSAGAELIITVDNGITAIAEAEKIRDLGMKLIITDHHQPYDELPQALAIVDPHRLGDLSEFKDICGAGVALKLCAALDGGDYTAVCEQYLDLTAIATVADVMPLVGENRVIVSRGLRLLENTENQGLLALMVKSGFKASVTSQSAAFGLTPKINAAGRFGNAETAYKLLTAEDPDEAAELADELSNLNGRRKNIESDIMEEIFKTVESDDSLKYSRVLVVAGEGWHSGIIGIVAARLVEIYERPAIVLSIRDGVAVGSARSVKGFNMFRCIEHCRSLLIKSGGHELAGGLTVAEENIPALRIAIEEFAQSEYPSMPVPTVEIDKILRGSEITYENAASLSRLQPCGNGNPEPVFAVVGAVVKGIIPLSGGEHTKVMADCGGSTVGALFFRKKTADFPYRPGDKIDICANISPDEYGSTKSASLIVIDSRPHGIKQDAYFSARDFYESFKRADPIPPSELRSKIPTREEMADIYRKLRSAGGKSTFDKLYAEICPVGGLDPFKLRISLDAFSEAGLIYYNNPGGRVEIIPPKEKADLFSVKTFVKLKELIEKGG